MRANAKRRGKVFDLTYEQFEQFVTKTGYIRKKGRLSTCLHIDRIEEHGNYTISNIQVLTNSENVRKYLRYYWDEQNKKMVFWNEVSKLNVKSDTPF
jgi:hypothetical protein